jgi:transcription termination factor Rho
VYVSVKQTRQYGLRKGDRVTGLSRIAGRNEKNPALLQILTVNDADPELMHQRPRFEDLTPLFPDEKLNLESSTDQTNMTARIIDLIAPIGKGQRGLIVSPPKAGKTFIMKTIATAIERNNPEVKLIVLLIDERPEEVTDMRRTVQGEVIASTFDRPSEEHTTSRSWPSRRPSAWWRPATTWSSSSTASPASAGPNLAAPATGRIMSGGIDAGALPTEEVLRRGTEHRGRAAR